MVLSRKSRQAVVVGGIDGGLERLLKITVLEISHGSVRLGFEAPADVPVHRLEIWERIRSGSLPDSVSCECDRCRRYGHYGYGKYDNDAHGNYGHNDRRSHIGNSNFGSPFHSVTEKQISCV